MTGELGNHIWQSTGFAVAIGLLTLCFRHNRAYVRYWLWLGASIKFLLPFTLLISLGARLAWTPVTRTISAAPAATLTLMQMGLPFSRSITPPSSPQGHGDWRTTAIFGIWACGFAAIVLIRIRDWRRIRAAVRASTPLRTLETVPVHSSPGLLEPGVVGLFRPILLLPAGITDRLQPSQLEAVLAHELCHVRRRDNLSSAIHMVVEAVFWFHPLVWWIGARLVEERERACDEAVLSLGNAPFDYAEGILNICKSYTVSPLSCVSGVTGASLKKRIEAILAMRITRDLSLAKKLFLGAAAIAAVSLPLGMGMMAASQVTAQAQPVTANFETISIRPCSAFHKSSVQDWLPGKLHSECTTVERLIQQAYGLFGTGKMNPGSSLTVVGGPNWTTSDLYQIDAKAQGPLGHSMMNGPVLQRVLEKRFNFRFHRETRERPIYELTVSRSGAQLQPFQGNCTPRDFDRLPSEADCGTARGYGNGFVLSAATMADLSAGLSVFLNRPVVDETGIAGRFNVHVDLSGEDRKLLNRPRALPAVSDPTAPVTPPIPFSAVKAAMEKQGLDLQPSEGPGESIVIDHIERPAGN